MALTDSPQLYDATAEIEREVKLPCEALVSLAPNVDLQPPLTRRGYGPTLVLVLPRVNDPDPIGDSTPTPTQIDPTPVQKWAEEGYTVLAFYAGSLDTEDWDLSKVLDQGVEKARIWGDKEDTDVVVEKVALIGRSSVLRSVLIQCTFPMLFQTISGHDLGRSRSFLFTTTSR
jgi:carboxymethylenebutenolidase